LIKSKPYGVTLVETMISLLILSIVSVISMNVLGNLNFSVKKISKVAEHQRGFIGFWRLLENDFFENSFMPGHLIKRNLFVDQNSLIFPNGVIWQWGNGELTRKSNALQEHQKLKVLKNIKRLELEIWDGKKFVAYNVENVKKTLFGPKLGFKVKLVKSSEVTYHKIFVLEEAQK
tara:strand:- start:1395 stop:1919 length:525 start_codon:yes stop_codon:yes gene_type:complete